jgi:CheY-like chemotaxis protein
MNSSRNARSIVVVVEDEVLVRWATAAALRDAGFEVLDVDSAVEALQLVEGRSDIAVVFTDINMPGSMDGLALAFEVKRRWPWMGLLVTSGNFRTCEPSLPVGGRFLAKPYSDVDLVAGVKALTPPATRARDGHLGNRSPGNSQAGNSQAGNSQGSR